MREDQRDLVRERTTAALAVKRANGQRVGTIPYGFDLHDDGQTLVANETEQVVLTEIREKRSRGWTLQRIANDLSERGIATKKARPRWSHQAVAYMLKHTAGR